MSRPFTGAVFLLTCAISLQIAGAQPDTAATAPGETVMQEAEIHPLIGGCGGAYLLAEPGELIVEVVKRDRNARQTTCELQAILAGPDRTVLQTEYIPDDGRPVGSGLGPAGSVVLKTNVERAGIYALNITASQDRYGDNFVWGMRTNCPRYMLETARGHRDARHQEPIVLESPGRPVDVCFLPRNGEFAIEIAGVPPDAGPVQLIDSAGTVLQTLEVGGDGKAGCTIPSAAGRENTPWRLHLPSGKGVIQADGLTRWDRSDPWENVCSWTPNPSSYFPVLDNRWLLTPYQRTVYSGAGNTDRLTFQVRNSARQERTIRLSLEFPGQVWPVRLGMSEVALGPGKSAAVPVEFDLPEGTAEMRCHIRATPDGREAVSTYSTLIARAGQAPALSALDMPIQLKPYRHENEQFGYLPDYPTESQFYFGIDNRPFARISSGLATIRDGEWITTDVRTAVGELPESLAGSSLSPLNTKVAFDRDGDLYILGSGRGFGVLLHSSDGGRTFDATQIPGRTGAWDIEEFTGNNIPDGPPPIVRFTRTQSDPKLIWRSLHDLELIVPRKVDGRIEMGEPVRISSTCIGLSAHSGIPSTVVSRGDKIHVAWGEATDPNEKVPGVPTYVATYDKSTGKLGEPALIGYGPPANDIHNSPSITMDADGYLHVLVGTHGRPFQYARSLAPNDASGGWIEPVSAGDDLSQTYIGFVCGPDGTLHVVFRLWRSGEPYPNSSYATLAYQRKRPGRPWEEPRILVAAAFSEYSVFYHRLTIDRQGRLFISYDYWSTHWFYRNDHFGSRRAVIMSPDGGETWKLVDNKDFQ
ncbi:MAG: BNR-4 repeat-containing protein [Armatimonadetes bacterium]|nr:BNR-4 repeat-containing protein [Armatimonadota bacterium]